MATHSSILAWKIPWMDQPGRLQSMRSQRVGHDWAITPSTAQRGPVVRENLIHQSGSWSVVCQGNRMIQPHPKPKTQQASLFTWQRQNSKRESMSMRNLTWQGISSPSPHSVGRSRSSRYHGLKAPSLEELQSQIAKGTDSRKARELGTFWLVCVINLP